MNKNNLCTINAKIYHSLEKKKEKKLYPHHLFSLTPPS
jgi:hypothetical protein